MRAALLHGIEDLRIEEIPTPSITDDEVLVRVTVCAVCPTDLRKYRTVDNGALKLPVNVGHEWVGEVARVGANVTDVAVGDRIVGGDYAGYAEYAPLRGLMLRPVSGKPLIIPPGVTDEEATFVEPLADAIHSIVDQGQVTAGQTVLIIGAGQLALQHVMVAKAIGARVIVSEPLAERQALATAFGADAVIPGGSPESVAEAVRALTSGSGADAAIVTVGISDAAITGLLAVRTRGRVVLFGGFERGTTTTLDLNVIHYKELVLTGSHWVGPMPYSNLELYGDALRMIANGKAPVSKLITHRVDLDHIHDAFDAIRSRSGMKAMVYIGSPLP